MKIKIKLKKTLYIIFKAVEYYAQVRKAFFVEEISSFRNEEIFRSTETIARTWRKIKSLNKINDKSFLIGEYYVTEIDSENRYKKYFAEKLSPKEIIKYYMQLNQK